MTQGPACLPTARAESPSTQTTLNLTIPTDPLSTPQNRTHRYRNTEIAIMEIRALVPFLVAMMLLTGVCNTLLTKYQVR